MSRMEILGVFQRNGYSMAAFSADYGCYQSAVSQFFKKNVPSEPMERAATAIARLLVRLEKRKAGA